MTPEPMSSHERILRMVEHREADRVPIVESPWGSTIERWQREGMPTPDFTAHFGLDRIVNVGVDNSPRYPAAVLEETEEYTITRSSYGVTMRNWRHAGGVPEFLDFTIVDRDSWAEAKARMTPSDDRIPWERLKRDYARWRAEGAWLSAGFWFGFDITHSWVVGTERVLLALMEDPDWIADIVNTMLELDLALWQRILDAGYAFDEIRWPDDLGYKGNQFMSPRMYRRIIMPAHQRAADWAHARGMKVRLHSCGDVNPLVPAFIEWGVDTLNPLEVKAGMDPVALKAAYGDRLAFHGGLNAVLYERPEEMWDEMHRVIPAMREGGGYIIASDHSVPDSVSLADFGEFVRLAKELGSYA
jgi:uroporphyrinogen decarboxylase